MQTVDIDTMPIDQLKADFWSIMNDNIIQYGDNLESSKDGREEEENTVSVQQVPARS